MENTIHHRARTRQKKYRQSSHGSQERSVLTVKVRVSVRVHEQAGWTFENNSQRLHHEDERRKERLNGENGVKEGVCGGDDDEGSIRV